MTVESSADPAHDPKWWQNQQNLAGAFENDPRWTAVDDYNASHLHNSRTNPTPDVAAAITAANDEAGLPPIAVSASQGKFLQLQARLIGAKSILEVGTLGGYSTVWLAASSKDVKVTTLELSPDFAKIARANFEQAGVADRIEVIEGNAVDTIPQIVKEVEEGKRPRIDLAFIDANKSNNADYFDWAVKIARPGALIIVDNVVRKGRVVDEKLAREDVNIAGTRRLIETVGKDERVDATVLQTVGDKSYDGFLSAIVLG